MLSRNFTAQLLLRAAAILITFSFAVYLAVYTPLRLTPGALVILALLQCIFLYRSITQVNDDVNRFLIAVKNRDHGLYFDPGKWGGSFEVMFRSFNDLIETHKDIAREKESVYELFRAILEKVNLGVIVIPEEALDGDRKQEIVFMNNAAEQLLGFPRQVHWHRLKESLPEFANEVKSLGKGGKKLVGIRLQRGKSWLLLEVCQMKLLDTGYLIITFQDFRSEIEQKEMEAWTMLMEILSHEIHNSITPLISLAGTMHDLLNEYPGGLPTESLPDLRLAAGTIKRRSEGLLGFVKDYQQVAGLPAPVLERCKVSQLFSHLVQLMQPMAAVQGIRLESEVTSESLRILADIKLIEQVLINLISNSFYALEGIASPVVHLQCREAGGSIVLEVGDNGKGIPAEHLERIFIPFFTTRQHGSGIGLTLSRQIMKLHKGRLEVSQRPGGGAIFTLIFP
jgi:two-component system nitrogen regulation sensor histidine kinase NtrY